MSAVSLRPSVCSPGLIDNQEQFPSILKITHNVRLCAYVVKEWKLMLNNMNKLQDIFYT